MIVLFEIFLCICHCARLGGQYNIKGEKINSLMLHLEGPEIFIGMN